MMIKITKARFFILVWLCRFGSWPNVENLNQPTKQPNLYQAASGGVAEVELGKEIMLEILKHRIFLLSVIWRLDKIYIFRNSKKSAYDSFVEKLMGSMLPAKMTWYGIKAL